MLQGQFRNPKNKFPKNFESTFCKFYQSLSFIEKSTPKRIHSNEIISRIGISRGHIGDNVQPFGYLVEHFFEQNVTIFSNTHVIKWNLGIERIVQ